MEFKPALFRALLSLSLLSLSLKIKGKLKTRNGSHEIAPSVWRIHFHKKETKKVFYIII
jgi:hypothetical protein